jgi:hypothetical protein
MPICLLSHVVPRDPTLIPRHPTLIPRHPTLMPRIGRLMLRLAHSGHGHGASDRSGIRTISKPDRPGSSQPVTCSASQL